MLTTCKQAVSSGASAKYLKMHDRKLTLLGKVFTSSNGLFLFNKLIKILLDVKKLEISRINVLGIIVISSISLCWNMLVR